MLNEQQHDEVYHRGFRDGWAVRDQGDKEFNPFKNRSNVNIIIDFIEKEYGIPVIKLASRTRKRNIVFPRQLCMYFLSKFTTLTLSGIGELLGGRDHTTVVHGRDKMQDYLSNKDVVALEIGQLEHNLLLIIQKREESKEMTIEDKCTIDFTKLQSFLKRKRILTDKELGIVPDKKAKENIPIPVARPKSEYSNTGHLKLIDSLLK